MFFKIGRQNIKGTGEIIDGEQEFQVDDFENICVSQTDFYEYQESEKLFNLRQNPKRMYYTISSKADEFALSVQNWNSGWKKIVHKCKQAIISKKQKQKKKKRRE